MDNQPAQDILTVAEFIQALNHALKELQAKIIGEVIYCKQAPSGHVYFTLKDKAQDAVIDCIMWKAAYRLNGVNITAGQELILTGSPNIYAQQGRLSFIAKTVEFAGEGALKKAYDELRQKLTQEGMLSDMRKRILPSFPQKIGIITSKNGAVIHDFVNNLGRRGYMIKFIDSRVEGKEAIFDLLSSMQRMQKEAIDTLIIMRGGGSLQSLAAFDNEAVVRAIADFPVPVIAAIGHHQDVPLAALVADTHVSTPTAAAHLVDATWDTAENTLQQYTQNLFVLYSSALLRTAHTIQTSKECIEAKFGRILAIFQDTQAAISTHLLKMQASTKYHRQTLNSRHITLVNAFNRQVKTMHTQLRNEAPYHRVFKRSLASHHEKLHTYFKKLLMHHVLNGANASIMHYEQLMAVHNPLRLLQQGYSILQKDGQVVKQIKDVTMGDTVSVLIADGIIQSEVKTTKAEKRN